MNDDDEICLCFHVSKRKVLQYIRVERPKLASQLSQCYGAGTGCGWCRPFLQRLLEQSADQTTSLPDADTYASKRQRYRKEQENK
ncbi:Nitrite reductase [NAD(P)H] [Rubripirellula obstinata]|uniref:Nitrite reductase [NAD(P)H] n=1 Tax=Rubripirellula obstinata TaxID=406547 RepID=A0A5B1CM41_9BACT|nr:(2Fe-2S)-binding protein [Rubripirellula obstinata]KAA1262138.1 Nitrite reductase [NAD(P)H] [Rubripirellula obstinata]